MCTISNSKSMGQGGDDMDQEDQEVAAGAAAGGNDGDDEFIEAGDIAAEFEVRHGTRTGYPLAYSSPVCLLWF